MYINMLKCFIIFIILFLFICILKKNNIKNSFSNNLINKKNLKNFNIVVVVPCIPKHLKHLEGLFKSINEQTHIPNKVIVSLSETEPSKNEQLRLEYKDKLNTELEFNCINEKQNAAENRNRAIKNYDNIDYISFMDADDEMCSSKIETIVKLMIKYNADMGLHAYDSGKNNSCKKGSIIKTPKEMKKIEKNCRDTLHISCLNIHHGHVTVTSKLFKNIKQNVNYNRGQDSKFVRDVFENNYRVIYTNDSLSNYYFERSSTKEGFKFTLENFINSIF